jgi:circadian clock protein KaiC
METGIQKSPTGIRGLDEITKGGLPTGRTTLLCGNAGCGKTVLAMQFLLNGATMYSEPGVYASFEETSEELCKNISSMGYDMDKLQEERKLVMDYVHIERNEILETGQYNLEGLFIRLGYAIDSIGAKRIVLDTVEALFSSFMNECILRAELRRLFSFLKSKGVTTLVTGERAGTTLTRYGLEEYVADCVILLQNDVQNQVATRRMRIIKYRGASYGTNEYPFLIDEKGTSVLPVTSLALNHSATREHVSSGISSLDGILGGKGYYRGSSILLSGTPGSGKTTIAVSFLDAGCKRGEKCVLFSYEESQDEIVRNMRSVGFNLDTWLKEGLLHIIAHRPSLEGLEMHLLTIHNEIEEINPGLVVVDPISSFSDIGDNIQIRSMLSRMVDYLKIKNITALFTDLLPLKESGDSMENLIYSVCDTWLLVQNNIEAKYRRGLSVVKARGMKHSDMFYRLAITDMGISLQ